MNSLLPGTATILACATLMAACTPSQSKPSASHPKAVSRQDQTPKLAVTGQGGTGDLPDPHHAGWLLWQLSFHSVTGVLQMQSVNMHGITAILFHQGLRDARVTAPTATADTSREVIVATDGVNYSSLTKPGTFMHAETVRWNARTQQGVAQGNVHYHDGKNGYNLYLPVLYFNSGLEKISTEPPSA